MKYGLIGEQVSKSFSKQIHNKLGYEYELASLSKDELTKLLKEKEFEGINVTIPYKEDVIKYLDEIDDSVKECNACNCIINKNSKLCGYNTDFYGFNYLLNFYDIDLSNKNILILGSGGTCKTVQAVLKRFSNINIYVVSRNVSEKTISYEEANKLDIHAIINTTPNGMINRGYKKLIDLSLFPNLETVIDVIYNPLRNELLLDAKELGLDYFNGLIMLVAQAIKAGELFLNKTISEAEILRIYQEIKQSKTNIVLIGMPCSGKTRNGLELANKLGYKFVDIDKEIEERYNISINEIFQTKGEDFFRDIESKMVADYASIPSIVISTGGGVIKRKENIRTLQKNGFIIFIDRDIENMKVGSKRPLIKSIDDYKKLYEERYDIYLQSCDVIIKNCEKIEKNIENMMEVIYENSCY